MTTIRRTRSQVTDEVMVVALSVGACPGGALAALGSQVGGRFHKSHKIFVPRIPLHSVNISECNGMCGTHSHTCRKIDICTWHSQRGGLHSQRLGTGRRAPPLCFKTHVNNNEQSTARSAARSASRTAACSAARSAARTIAHSAARSTARTAARTAARRRSHRRSQRVPKHCPYR